MIVENDIESRWIISGRGEVEGEVTGEKEGAIDSEGNVGVIGGVVRRDNGREEEGRGARRWES